MAPEMFDEAGNEGTDQFALGVCLWRIFTEIWPYGEVEVFSRPRFRRPEAPGKARPDLPAWLEAVLMRCVAIDPASVSAMWSICCASWRAGRLSTGVRCARCP
jgi:hypothetical protein